MRASLFVAIMIIFASCDTNSKQLIYSMTDIPNTLPECPDSPNCERVTIQLDLTADTLLVAIEKALSTMNAYSIEVQKDSNRIDAVFRIPVFGWKDDVAILIEPADDTMQHVFIRSASRVGYSDLGVNKRRVRRLLKHLNNLLNSQ